MQPYAQKKIVIAVGAALMVMAGAAQAAVPAGPPIARAVKPVLATPATVPNATSLYGATGFTGSVPVKVNFTAPADSTGGANFALVTAGFDGLKVNTANDAAPTTGAADATDDIIVYAGTLGATQINLQVPNASKAFTSNIVTTSAADAAFTIVTSGNEALRINPTTGAFEYTADKNAATITWLPVSIAVQVPAQTGTVRNAITANDSTDVGPLDHEAATSTVIAAIAGQSAFNTVAPTATAKTVGTGGLVNGVVIDTVTPLSAAIVVNSATTGLAFTSNVAACSPGADTNNAADIAATVAVAPATPLTATIAGSLNTVTFAGATTDWTTGDATVDAAAYVSNCFHTGIATGSLPFTIGVTATAANRPTYSLVFTAAGAPQVLAALPTIDDGVAPTITAATLGTAAIVAPFTTPLNLTFSEPMDIDAGAATALSALREVGENVFLNSDSLAALNLNAGGTLTISGAGVLPGFTGSITPTAGKSTLEIDGIQTADLTGKTVTVKTGIALKESNDVGFNSALPALDEDGLVWSGGVLSTSGATEGASVSALPLTAGTVTIAFSDTTASAATTVLDPTKIGLIAVSFPAGKGVGFNTGKTFANLTGQIVVTITGNSVAGDPVTFQFFPTAIATGGVPVAGQMVLSASTAGSANKLIINPPTDLIYSKITAPIAGTITVRYLNLDGGVPTNVLVGTIAAAPVVSAAIETVILPLSAKATSTNLLTQSISGTLTGASSGSLVHAHLAKWVGKSTTLPSTVSIVAGKITNPSDKVATDLAIQYTTTGGGQKAALQTLIAAQVNSAAAAKAAVPGVSNATTAVKAAPIPVYVQLVRSSDTQASSKTEQNYLEARAILSTVADDPAFVANIAAVTPVGATNVSPVYQVMLDPLSGVISGRLTGNLTLKTVPGATVPAGVTIIAADVAQGLVDGDGKFSLIVATEPNTADIAMGKTGLADQFLILVHEDQTNARKYTQLTSASPNAANYLPYSPNLYSLSGTRTTLGVAPGFAAPTDGKTAAVPILLSNYKVDNLTNSTAWALLSLGTPAGKLVLDTPRSFVGIDSDLATGGTGLVKSYWSSGAAGPGDGNTSDMALAMVGNKVGVATELSSGDTLSTISNATFVAGASALAFKNDSPGPLQTLTFAQAAAPASVKVPAGWSLVQVPTGGLNSATVESVLRVGAQTTANVTWFKADGAMPSFTAGDAVFVYSPKGGSL